MQSLRAIAWGAVTAATIGMTPLSAQWKTDFGTHVVPLEEIVSGGPPKDGIPPLDHPTFVSIGDADRWLDDREPVVVIELEGQARAYPLQILMWHEIVNDHVGGRYVTVTFCPLCNTALAFDRRFDGRVLDFGTTGMLRHSDLVMYDRQTETWWQQATGQAIVGTYAGRSLDVISAPLVNWETFKDNYPTGEVLSRETGFARNYGQNPYARYDSRSGPYSRFFSRRSDDRLEAMTRVVALTAGDSSVAYPFSEMESSPVVNDWFSGTPIVVLWAPGTASALDDGRIARGRDVGSSGVFDRRLDGRLLEFVADAPGTFRDRATGSIWNILGHAVGGALTGQRLHPVQHGNHFWFAWGTFKPDTRVWRAP